MGAGQSILQSGRSQAADFWLKCLASTFNSAGFRSVEIGEGARPRAPRARATLRYIFVQNHDTCSASVRTDREDAIPPGAMGLYAFQARSA
jgi:hypothetical protein